MRLKYILVVFLVLVIVAVLYVFRDPYAGKFNRPNNRAVHLSYANGQYTLYRFGKPFFIKGAAGTTFLPQLNAAGGNTIRTWDTVGLNNILATAQQQNIAVIVGLPMPYNDDMDAFYNRPEKVRAQFESYRALVRKYRNNKAILCWCLGNELAFPFRPKFNNFYTAFNHLVDMIHHNDPDHPVTTTVMNLPKKNMFNIKLRTQIDFVSFNIFGALRHFSTDLKTFSKIWNGPFLITEWAIDGPWPGYDQTAWGAYIERTSSKKAEQYRELYQKYMPLKDPHFLGNLVFYWGQKQETTPTWFSMLDKHGNKSAAVDVMQSIWTGKPVANGAPVIKYMLLNDKGAKDNIIYKAGASIKAKLLMADTTQYKNLRFEWFMQPEDWFRVHHFYNQKAKATLNDLLAYQNGALAVFCAPEEEGPYRIYVNVYNDKGYFATCNTPFYVVEDK